MANPFLFADNARSTLGASLSIGGTTITLASGGGALFPNPGPNQQFALTLNDAATQALFETVWCTSRAGDVLTVLRAQEGTSALAWGIGDFCWNGPTAGQMNNLVQTPHMLDASIAPVFSNTQVQGTFSATGAASFNSTGTFAGAISSVDSNAANAGGVTVGNSGANGARIRLQGTPGTSGTPNKTIQAVNGTLGIQNSSGNATIWSLSDLGDVGNIRSVTASGGGTFGGPIVSASSGSFTDPGVAGIAIHPGPSGANIQLIGTGTTPNKFIRSVGGLLQVVNSGYTNTIFSVDDVGNFTANGNGTIAGTLQTNVNINAGGSVSGNTVQANNGNVTAFGGRLRASLGAKGSGDPNAATILADFPSSIGGIGFQSLPNGLIIQWGIQSLNGNPAIGNNFPIAFPNACLTVVCTEGAAQGAWFAATNPSPTIHAVSGFNQTQWFHAGVIWLGGNGPWIVANLTTCWVAIGF